MMQQEGREESDGSECGRCGRRLLRGWFLCSQCGEELPPSLLECSERFARLDARPVYEPNRPRASSSGKPGSRPPGNLEVMTLRDLRSSVEAPQHWRGADGKEHQESGRDTPSALATLAFWAARIAEARDVDYPTMTNVDECVDFLYRQEEAWLARWEYSGRLAEEVRVLRNKLRSANRERNQRPVCKCIAKLYDENGRQVVDSEGEPVPCGYLVFPPPSEAATPSDGIVRCVGRERHSYGPWDLAKLARAQYRAMEQAREEKLAAKARKRREKTAGAEDAAS